MLYQEYKAKLNKRKRLFDSLWKYRLLILAGVILLLATSGTLLGVKGIVYDFTVPVQTLRYGETFTAFADCVFGEAAFEYRAVGEQQWTMQRPIYAGKYECRPVGKTVVGSWHAGEIQTFEIQPIDVDVAVYGKYYGDEPVFYAEMPYGDKLQVNKYTYERNSDEILVSFDVEDVVAISTDGKDVTSSYVFTTQTVSVEQRPVTVTMPSETVEYDGTPHQTEGAQADDGLLPEHHLEVVAKDSFTEVGSHTNSARSVKIVDDNGKDMTNMYDVTCLDGTVNVAARQITVTTGSLSTVTYDGTPHNAETFEISAEKQMAEGQTLKLTYKSWTDAGEYSNVPNADYKITRNDDGADVTNNYAIEWNYGTVNIAKRAISVQTQSDIRTYDGQTHTYDSPTVQGELVAGQELHYTNILNVINAGEYNNEPQISVYSGDTNVTKNYAISVAYGKVTVNRFDINFEVKSETIDYDGREHVYYPTPDRNPIDGQQLSYPNILNVTDAGIYTNDPHIAVYEGDRDVSSNYNFIYTAETVTINKIDIRFDITSETIDYDGKPHEYQPKPSRQPVAGQRLEYSTLTVTKADTYINDPDIAVYDGDDQDMSANYNFIYTAGEITIKPVPITVTFAGGNVQYNGKEQVFASEVTGKAVDGQDLFISYQSLGVTNVNTYYFTPDILVYENGVDVTENYTIIRDFHEVVVTPIELTVTTKTETFTYDGKNHVYDVDTLTYEKGLLAEGQEIRLFDVLSKKNVGEYHNTPTIVVYDGENEVTLNYVITPVYGNVTITPRAITLSTEDYTVEYVGRNGHTYNTIKCDNLAADDRLEVAPFSVVDAGAYDNKPQYQIWDVNGVNALGNYTIEEKFGKIIVTPIEITFTATSETFTYDGYWHEYYPDIGIRLAEGDTFGCLNVLREKNAGTYTNNPTIIVYGGGSDYKEVTDLNYKITVEPGTVIIERYDISLQTGDEFVFYTGQLYVPDDSTLTFAPGTTLQGNDRYILDYSDLEIIDFKEGGYSNHPVISFVDAEGTSVQDNYNIKMILYGTITIKKRFMKVSVSDISLEYNGRLQGEDDVSYYYDNSYEDGFGIADGQVLTVHNSAQLKDFGSTKLVLTWSVTSNGVSVSDNYIITVTTYGEGTLTITQRSISFNTESDEQVYNGQPFSRGDVAVSGLVEEHKIDYHLTSDLPSLTDVGQIVNKFTFTVTIKDGEEDVTSNYDVESAYSDVTYGTLTVTVRAVTLTSESAELTYNAQPHTFGDVTADGLVEWHNVIATFDSFTSAGEHENAPLEGWKIVDREGNPVSSENYSVKWVHGTVTIDPRPITVATGSTESIIVYDGQPHSVKTFTVQSPNYFEEYGHKLVVTQYPSFEDASNHLNIWDGYWHIEDGNGNEMTNNYDVEWEWGTIQIVRREITVKTASATSVYNGTNQFFNDDFEVISDLGLVEGHNLTITCRPCMSANTYTNEHRSYSIKKGDGTVVTDNYSITWEYGTVTITKRPITVKLKDGVDWTWTYDGTSHLTTNDFVIASDESYPPLDSYFILKVTVPTLTEAGTYKAGEGQFKYSVEDSIDITFYDFGSVKTNFDITDAVTGTPLTIKQRPVTIKTNSHTWVYESGQEYRDTGYVAEQLLPGHYVSDDFAPVLNSITDRNNQVWYVDNVVQNTVRILDSVGTDRTANYQITVEAGKLRVKSPIEILVYSVKKTYNGEEITIADLMYEITTLPPDVTDADVKLNLTCGSIKFGAISLKAFAEANADKVEVQCEDGIYGVKFIGQGNVIEITKRQITINTATVKSVENGSPLYANSYRISRGQLVEGDILTATVTGVLQPGESGALNTLDRNSISIVNADGEDVTEYYDIKIKEGTLSWATE